MVELPNEIARQIAAELDIESARCLARAGRSVRDIGEMRVWQKVHIMTESVAGGHQDTLATPTQRLLDCLQSYPSRVAYLSQLTMSHPPRTDTSMELILHLLSTISGTVQHLDLHLPAIEPAELAQSVMIINHYQTFLARLSENVQTWDKVLELRLSVIGPHGLSLIRPLVAACPRLQALVLHPLNFPDSRLADHGPKDGATDDAYPPLRYLRRLTIASLFPPAPSSHISLPTHMEATAFRPIRERCYEILDRVVPQASDIETLTIDGPHLLDGPTLKRTIEILPKLQRLFLDSTHDIKWGPVTQLDTDLSELWLRRSSLYGPYASTSAGSAKLTGPRTESTPYLPLIPHLRVLTFCGPPIESRSSCWDSWRGLEPYPPGVSPVMDDIALADHFRFQPKLEMVLIQPANPDWGSADRWPREGLRDQHGVTVCSYPHPYFTDNDRVFWHVRSTRPHWTGACRHLTVYRNQLVPAAVIRQVYEASGQSMDWLTTRLNCRFGTTATDRHVDEAREADAWDVLDSWAVQAPQEKSKASTRPSIFPPVAI